MIRQDITCISSTMKNLKHCLSGAAITLFVAVPASAASTHQEERVSYPGEGQLSSADYREGAPALLAWRSTDKKWSKLELRENGAVQAEWGFPGELVKDARWIEPGKTLLTFTLRLSGSEDRLYRIDSAGELQLEWSSRDLESSFQSIGYSRDGMYWLGSRFEKNEAYVALGRVGNDSPISEWRLDAATYGEPTELDLQEFSYSIFVEHSSSTPPDVGILWGARLWVGRPSSEHLVRVELPGSCLNVSGATSTNRGLWVDCYRGMEAKRSHGYILYRDGFTEGAEKLTADLVEEFNDPTFRQDGTVLDLDIHAGRIDVYEVGRGTPSVSYLGALSVPAHTRPRPAGDVLLVALSDIADEYRVLPLEREIATLHQAAREER